MNVFIRGVVTSGIRAGINERTALAVTSELELTSLRGEHVTVLMFTNHPILPLSSVGAFNRLVL